MNIGESTIAVGEHATLGPVRIELYQPQPSPKPLPKPASATDKLLGMLLSEQRLTNTLLSQIYTHLTRPTLWQRFIRKVKRICGMPQ